MTAVTDDRNPEYELWDRSVHHPQFVVVPLNLVINNGEFSTVCDMCEFGVRKYSGLSDTGCSAHYCGGAVWLHETQAVVLRLEE